MKKSILLVISLIGILSSSPVLSIDVGIGAFLNRLAYPLDETIDFYISGFNRGANPELVDVHIGIIDAKGMIYEYPNWNTNLVPWLSSFVIPADFRFPVTKLGNLDNFPGGLKPGSYKFAVALTTPNTLNILSFYTTAFKVVSLESRLTSGGISFAHGQSAAGVTEPIASAAAGFLRIETDQIAEFQKISDLTFGDIERCQFHKTPASLDSNLHAGQTLLLSSPLAGNVILNWSINSLSYGAFPAPSENFYQAGQLYTVTGNGGTDIPAFTVSAIAPKEIIVTQPDLAKLESIDSKQDFILRWEGNGGIGEITLTLQGGRGENSHAIVCRFADDGEGNIPSNLLHQLHDSVTSTPSNIPDIPGFDLPGLIPESAVNIVLSRHRLEFINNDDEDTTLLNILWATSLVAEIQ